MAEQLGVESPGSILREADRRLRNLESSRRLVSLHNRVVRIRRSADQVVAPSTSFDVLFDVEDEDPEGWIAVTASTLTVPIDGFYVGRLTFTITAGAVLVAINYCDVANNHILIDAGGSGTLGYLNFAAFQAAGDQFKFRGISTAAGLTFTARLDIARVSF